MVGWDEALWDEGLWLGEESLYPPVEYVGQLRREPTGASNLIRQE